jgi:hypothetical protein
MSEQTIYKIPRFLTLFVAVICLGIAAILWHFDITRDVEFGASFLRGFVNVVVFVLVIAGIPFFISAFLPSAYFTLSNKGFYYSKYPDVFVEWKDISEITTAYPGPRIQLKLENKYHPILLAQVRGDMHSVEKMTGILSIQLWRFTPNHLEVLTAIKEGLKSQRRAEATVAFEAYFEEVVQEIALEEGRDEKQVREELAKEKLGYAHIFALEEGTEMPYIEVLDYDGPKSETPDYNNQDRWL